jgi:hypothetical protein
MPMEKVAQLIREAVRDAGVMHALRADPGRLQKTLALSDAHVKALKTAEAFSPITKAAPPQPTAATALGDTVSELDGAIAEDTGEGNALLPAEGTGGSMGGTMGPGACPEPVGPIGPSPTAPPTKAPAAPTSPSVPVPAVPRRAPAGPVRVPTAPIPSPHPPMVPGPPTRSPEPPSPWPPMLPHPVPSSVPRPAPQSPQPGPVLQPVMPRTPTSTPTATPPPGAAAGSTDSHGPGTPSSVPQQLPIVPPSTGCCDCGAAIVGIVSIVSNTAMTAISAITACARER